MGINEAEVSPLSAQANAESTQHVDHHEHLFAERDALCTTPSDCLSSQRRTDIARTATFVKITAVRLDPRRLPSLRAVLA